MKKIFDLNKLKLQKALTSGNTSGGALVPQDLEKIITNTVQRLTPEINIIKPTKVESKTHEFNKLLSLGQIGAPVGENAVTHTRSSNFQRASVNLKIIRRKGAVTSFLQDSSESAYDAKAIEFENSLRAHSLDLINSIVFGNANANSYDFDGWYTLIETNILNGFTGGNPSTPPGTDLKFLDDMIDASNRNGGLGHERYFVMTPEMLSLVSRRLTNVTQFQNRPGALATTEISGGWRLLTYRDIPILESTLMGGKGVTTSDSVGTVVAGSPSNTGGNLSNGTYYGRLVAITQFGETIPSPQFTITLFVGTSTQKFTISWTDVPNAYYYKLYLGNSPTSVTLKRIFSAFTYDAAGTIAGRVTSFEVTSLTAGAEVPTNKQNEIPALQVSGVNAENILLIDTHKYEGLGKFAYVHSTGNRVDGLISIQPLAQTDDKEEFLVKTYGAIVPAYEKTSVWYRGLRVE
jgi:hypothetical protein